MSLRDVSKVGGRSWEESWRWLELEGRPTKHPSNRESGRLTDSPPSQSSHIEMQEKYCVDCYDIYSIHSHDNSDGFRRKLTHLALDDVKHVSFDYTILNMQAG